MNATYELRATFGDMAEDITVDEFDGNFIRLQQGAEEILIPNEDAAAFVDKLGDWLSYGRHPS